MMKIRITMVAAALVAVLVVGDGVNNADSRNGENGVSTINPPVGTSFLPGKNKVVEKSNPNVHNSSDPGYLGIVWHSFTRT